MSSHFLRDYRQHKKSEQSMRDTTSLDTWFANKLDDLAHSYSGKQVAIFFLGMSSHQALLINSSHHAASTLDEILDNNGVLNLSLLKATNKKTFLELLGADHPLFMLYEQLVDIKSSLSEMYDGDIVIVRNNLFTSREGYPTAIPDGVLAKTSKSLYDADEGGDCPADAYCASCTKLNSGYLVVPKLVHDDLACNIVDLIEPIAYQPSSGQGSRYPISIPSSQYIDFRLDLCNGKTHAASFLIDEKQSTKISSLLSLLQALNCPYTIEIQSPATNEHDHNGDRLTPTLKKYWGEKAGYRPLSFYKNPDVDNEMHVITQGEIADFVVRQAEIALEGSDAFSNVFVTAPTGAGKSLLFQLPALYLAHTKNAVTLIIEPLKQLMIDQVNNLRRQGATCVAAINSDISYHERLAEYENIRTGQTSIVYLSPELLLNSSIDTILNGRELALVVIDEVHTVTSWGIDFRPDYWYLGSYLERLRRRGMQFPTFCLTATAVYGGKDDVVSQSISTLELANCRVYLGNPRRNDIDFDIRVRNKGDFPGPIEEVKTELACSWINDAVRNNDHAIVYCPYRTQVDSVVGSLPNTDARILGFHAGYDASYKNVVSQAFKNGSCRVLISTKAFGMGIDIDDINKIYHYAPTGNLADYIQEVGRGARKKNCRATAVIDYFKQDNRYATQLYAMSRFSQWQLREVMNKLYSLYSAKAPGKRSMNMLISPGSFSYLFANERDENTKVNRVKAALMMISQDLEDRYTFPVLIVRPKTTYTKQFVCIEKEYEQYYLDNYGPFLKKISAANTRIESRVNQSNTFISDMGSIYLVDLARMWESRFPSYTFAQFKRSFFMGELEEEPNGKHVSTRLSLNVSFARQFDSILPQLDSYLEALTKTIRTLAQVGEFTSQQFDRAFNGELGDSIPKVRQTASLLNALVMSVNGSHNALKCLVKKTSKKGGSIPLVTYAAKGNRLLSLSSTAKRAVQKLKPLTGNTRRLFLNPKALGECYEAVELLQILGLAAYEIRGGDDPEIFVRLNDPSKLKGLANNPRYNNRVLQTLNARHEYAARVISGFFTTKLDNEERWDLIEEYFLGNDEYVASVLHLSNDLSAEEQLSIRKVKYRNDEKIRLGLRASLNCHEPIQTQPMFRVWRQLLQTCDNSREIDDLHTLIQLTRGSHFAMPIYRPELTIDSSELKLHPILAWEKQQVAMFDLAHTGEYEQAQKTNWETYLLGQGSHLEKLAQSIKLEKGSS